MTVTLSNTPEIETERLVLRAPRAEDWPAWREMALSDRSRFIRDPDFDEGRAWRGMGHIIGHWVLRGWGSFIITRKDSDAALGMAGPWYPAGWPEPEIGWSLWQAEAEGHGYATEAAWAARDFAFHSLGWKTAVSYVDPDNVSSAAVAQRLGATPDTTAKAPDPGTSIVFRHPAPDNLS